MGHTIGLPRGFLLLALLLPLLGTSSSAAAHSKGKSFDIPAQPMASALNEFAKQADVTLIFSYDLVDGERTRPLKGRFTVDAALRRLLSATTLGYRREVNGTYRICSPAACELPLSTMPERAGSADHEATQIGIAETRRCPVFKTSR